MAQTITNEVGKPIKFSRVEVVCFRKDLNIDSFKFPKANEKKISLFDILEENPSRCIETIKLSANAMMSLNGETFDTTAMPSGKETLAFYKREAKLVRKG